MEAEPRLVEFVLGAGEIRMLLAAVTEKQQRWAGGDPGEQAQLAHMRQVLFAALLDVTF
jgi:hypothetical protein